MKIGITQIIVPGSLQGLLQLCQDAGYEAVELSFGEGRDPDINLDEAGIRAVGERCKQAGVACTSIIARYSRGVSSVPTLNSGRGLVDHCQGLLRLQPCLAHGRYCCTRGR
jgi:sugar phosphate isomerase/epimerase